MDEVKLLDHGYIRLVEYWGSDQAIVEAARMSTGKGFLFPILFLVAGALLLALATRAPLVEIGKALFWAGAFALAFHLAAHPLHL